MSMRRASIAGLEMQSDIKNKPAPGGSFGRRMSLASLGSRKYGRAFDSYSEASAQVIVRHIPIVIEGDESDSESIIVNEGRVNVPVNYSGSTSYFPQVKSSRAWSIADDRSSLSSHSSDNSIESSRRKNKGEEVVRAWMIRNEDDKNSFSIQSSENWRKKGRDGGEGKEREMTGNIGVRKPFKDITQNKHLYNKSKAIRKTSLDRPQYLIETETVGAKTCPVHGETEKAKGRNFRIEKKNSTVEPASVPLKAPALIRRNNTNPSKVNPDKKLSAIPHARPKHSTNLPIKTSKENTGIEREETKKFERGPGQWSFRGIRSKIDNSTKSEHKNKTEEAQNPDPAFQRRWSFRAPTLPSNKTTSDITLSFQAPTISSLSRSLSGPLQLPEYFRKAGIDKKEEQVPPLKKYSSQVDLNTHASKTITPVLEASNVRMTPSSSTSSIPSKVSKEFEHVTRSKPLCVGILKTPGKRKISSNNRVEFLDNLREREIPGRHT